MRDSTHFRSHILLPAGYTNYFTGVVLYWYCRHVPAFIDSFQRDEHPGHVDLIGYLNNNKWFDFPRVENDSKMSSYTGNVHCKSFPLLKKP